VLGLDRWVCGCWGLIVCQVSLTQFSNTCNKDHTNPPAVYSALCEISKILFGRIDCDDAHYCCKQLESF
jgi:hypothetical protein